MLDNRNPSDSVSHIVERRIQLRAPVRSVAYIDLGQDNGGLILNVSKGGVAVQAAEVLTGTVFERMRFQLPKSEGWIEVRGELVWQGQSRKEAGIRFVNPSNEACQQIQDWVHSQVPSSSTAPQNGGFKPAREASVEGRAGTLPSAADASNPLSEFGSMFPSEKTLSEAENRSQRRKPLRPNGEDAAGVPRPKDRSASLFPPEPEQPPLGRSTADWQPPLRQFPSESTGSRQPGLPRRPTTVAVDQVQEQVPPVAPAERRPEGAGRDASAAPQRPRDPASDTPMSWREFYRNQGGSRAPAVDSSAANSSANPVPGPSRNPMPGWDPQPISFTGFGYQAPEFEEPSGKGWLAVAGVLLLILTAGAVLAMGPGNVKALLSEKLSALTGRVAPSPPVVTSEKIPTDANEPAAQSAQPPANPPEPESLPNPGLRDQANAASSEQSPDAKSADAETAEESRTASTPAPPRAAPPVAVGGNASTASDDDAESAEEITRRFQLEHGAHLTPSAPAAESFSQPQPVAPANARPIAPAALPPARNERTLDAYARPEDGPASRENAPQAPAAAPARQSSFGSPAIPTGTVAIRSHFVSVLGSEPIPDGGRLTVGQLVSMKQPVYPLEAARERIEGTVQLRATVDPIGNVEVIHLVSGPPILVPAALNAVHEWRYGQTILAGRAVECVEDIAVVFRLANSVDSPR